MKKIITLLIVIGSIFVMTTSAYAECTTHSYNTFVCPLIGICECGAIQGEHNFVSGICTACSALENSEERVAASDEAKDSGKCPTCGGVLRTYEESNINGLRCDGCGYWTVGDLIKGSCQSDHPEALMWVSNQSVSSYMCTKCNKRVETVAACQLCGTVVTPQIRNGYIMYTHCGQDITVPIGNPVAEKCSKDSMVLGHFWKWSVGITKDDNLIYTIICKSCNIVIDKIEVTPDLNDSSVDLGNKTPLKTSKEIVLPKCTCKDGGTQATPMTWKYAGWNVTNTRHYTSCAKCGGTIKSEPHNFENGKCTTCGFEENMTVSDRCTCADGGKQANPITWDYNGWNVNNNEHYTLCQNCNKILRIGKHSFNKGACETCGLKEGTILQECKHESSKLIKIYNFDPNYTSPPGKHYYQLSCKCGYYDVPNSYTEEWCTMNSSLSCKFCGKPCPHPDELQKTVYNYSTEIDCPSNKHYSRKECTLCGKKYGFEGPVDCVYDSKTEKCVCEKSKPAESLNLVGYTQYEIPFSEELQKYLYDKCCKYGVSDMYEILLAQIRKESGYNPNAKSPDGRCLGLGQLTGEYREFYTELTGIENIDFYNPEQNIEIMAALTEYDLAYCHGDIIAALIAYNNGIGSDEIYLYLDGSIDGTPYTDKVLNEYVPELKPIEGQ